MKKVRFSFICMIFLISGCNQPNEEMIGHPNAQTELAGIYEKTDIASTEQEEPTIVPTNGNVYRITRKTGLYQSHTSEEHLYLLTSGTKVKPANNSTRLDCRTAEFEGISITSCWVEVVNTGKTGWVSQNAIGN